jgi:DNA-binding beta-propeller fold protein YncE
MRYSVLLFAAGLASAQLRHVQTLPLAGVEGRIDHLAVDVAGKRLFVAALVNNTVEVVDLAAGRRVHTLKGFPEPQGIAYVPEFRRLYVATGGDGRCVILDNATFARIASADLGSDADNVRYDPSARSVWVGYGKGAIAEIDPASGKRLGEIVLPAHPESFQLERNGPRLFVNLPDAGCIAVADRRRRTILTRWPAPGAANFPMSLDEAGRRLFVGCRRPPEVRVFDTESGKLVAAFPCPGDTDDVFYDAARKLIYVSGGEGSVGVYRQAARDDYRPAFAVRTASGARTSLFVPESGRLYVAVPHRGPRQGAEIRVYQAE